MRSFRQDSPAPGWCRIALVLLCAVSCGRQEPAPEDQMPPGEWRAFEGSWSASGTRHSLHFGPDHRSTVSHLEGSMLLVGQRRLGVGFHAEAIAFADSKTGLTGRCVWTDERGDQIFSELKGDFIKTGNHVVGTLVGGTGRFAGVTGDFGFEWQYVIASDDGDVSGRAIGLAGRACIGTPPGEAGR